MGEKGELRGQIRSVRFANELSIPCPFFQGTTQNGCFPFWSLFKTAKQGTSGYPRTRRATRTVALGSSVFESPASSLLNMTATMRAETPGQNMQSEAMAAHSCPSSRKKPTLHPPPTKIRPPKNQEEQATPHKSRLCLSRAQNSACESGSSLCQSARQHPPSVAARPSMPGNATNGQIVELEKRVTSHPCGRVPLKKMATHPFSQSVSESMSSASTNVHRRSTKPKDHRLPAANPVRPSPSFYLVV